MRVVADSTGGEERGSWPTSQGERNVGCGQPHKGRWLRVVADRTRGDECGSKYTAQGERNAGRGIPHKGRGISGVDTGTTAGGRFLYTATTNRPYWFSAWDQQPVLKMCYLSNYVMVSQHKGICYWLTLLRHSVLVEKHQGTLRIYCQLILKQI